MKTILLVCGAAGMLGMAAPALSQSDDFDVTLEVLDDVSDVDAVILSLREERDELERRETGERDGERDRERDARDERADVERELERDFERDRGRELDGRDDDRDVVIEDRDIERERDEQRNEEGDALDRELEERDVLEAEARNGELEAL